MGHVETIGTTMNESNNMNKSSAWWRAIVPKVHESSWDLIVNWLSDTLAATFKGNNADCTWWMVEKQIDEFPCYEAIFHCSDPITKLYIMKELGWEKEFPLLDVFPCCKQYLDTLLFLQSFDQGPWTNEHELDPPSFESVVTSLPNGTVHLLYSSCAKNTTAITQFLEKHHVMVLFVHENDNPLRIADYVRPIAHNRQVVLIYHYNFHILPFNPNFMFWYFNRFQTIVPR